MKPDIEYIPDDSVNDVLDQELRVLLTTCFTKPRDLVFRNRRYFREPYRHRWVIRDNQGKIVAHIGVHEKKVEAGGCMFRVGGIAEVCVHPDCRGKGYVRMMLQCVHGWLSEKGFTFAFLFGDPLVYGSSGYVQIGNLFHGGGEHGWKQVKAMIRELSLTSWPSGDVHLPGPTF